MTKERRVRIVTDPDPCNPCEELYESSSRMVCWHRRYNLGDKHDYDNPTAFRYDVDLDDCVILPLYLYDHSGITMRTAPFDCTWDSGQVGYIYFDRNALKREFNYDKERAERALRSEVEVYDAYIRGAVYGFIVEERGGDDGDHWEEVDGCWGFYGHDIHTNGIADSLADDELIALAESADIE